MTNKTDDGNNRNGAIFLSHPLSSSIWTHRFPHLLLLHHLLLLLLLLSLSLSPSQPPKSPKSLSQDPTSFSFCFCHPSLPRARQAKGALHQLMMPRGTHRSSLVVRHVPWPCAFACRSVCSFSLSLSLFFSGLFSSALQSCALLHTSFLSPLLRLRRLRVRRRRHSQCPSFCKFGGDADAAVTARSHCVESWPFRPGRLLPWLLEEGSALPERAELNFFKRAPSFLELLPFSSPCSSLSLFSPGLLF